MSIINAGVEAGGSLVAPDWSAALSHDVGEGAVEELKQLIPLSGVVQTRLVTPEAYGVVNDVLQSQGERGRVSYS